MTFLKRQARMFLATLVALLLMIGVAACEEPTEPEAPPAPEPGVEEPAAPDTPTPEPEDPAAPDETGPGNGTPGNGGGL